MICPCGSLKEYEACCEKLISGDHFPDTPEQLMRSRYTAYTLANMNYIANTMKGIAAKDFDIEASKKWAESVKWLKLTVIKTSIESNKGWVEFIAYYEENGLKQILHEKSEFHRIDGRWYYVSGVNPKINRNESCPCGSGKKFKKCCLA